MAVTKSRVPRCAIVSRLRPRAWSKSNSSRLLRAGNRAARMRPSPPWASRAATSRCRQAARNSSCVQPSARARSASRAGGLAQGRGLQRPGQERELGGQVPGGGLGWRPSRHLPVVRGRRRRRSRPGSAARPRPWSRPVALRLARPRSWRGAATWSGSVRVWWRAQQRPWSATSRPRSRPAPVQVGGHLDAAADHRRVDRVVVGIQPHVVVARQPQRAAPARRRRDRRQRQHRGPVSVDPVGWGAAQHPAVALVDQARASRQAGR